MLIFNYGCMGAGKTALALQERQKYISVDLNVLLLKPEYDIREGVTTVRSRNGMEAEAIVIPYLSPNFIYDYFYEHQKEVDVIIVDEAQFLTPRQVDNLRDIVDEFDINVYAFGLRTDFRKMLFPGSAHLLAVADVIKEIQSFCSCGRKAVFNARFNKDWLVTEGKQILIGGDETYKALCPNCYNKIRFEQYGKAARENVN